VVLRIKDSLTDSLFAAGGLKTVTRIENSPHLYFACKQQLC